MKKAGCMSEQTSVEPEQATVHPRGYKMSDEEMERIQRKSESADVLDPIALHDPVGLSVEKVIGRALLVVILALVVGILFAQVACKNIQLWGIPSFTSGVTSGTVEKALASGVSWAGEIVKFPEAQACEYDEGSKSVRVVVGNTSQHTMTSLIDATQRQAFALAMSLFASDDVDRVEYVVVAPVDEGTGEYVASSSSENLAPVLSVVWFRDADAGLSCRVEGFDPLVKKAYDRE